MHAIIDVRPELYDLSSGIETKTKIFVSGQDDSPYPGNLGLRMLFSAESELYERAPKQNGDTDEYHHVVVLLLLLCRCCVRFRTNCV